MTTYYEDFSALSLSARRCRPGMLTPFPAAIAKRKQPPLHQELPSLTILFPAPPQRWREKG
ncbi:MAG: hypothetical protein V4671_05490 [Armatimonadota bacterium]